MIISKLSCSLHGEPQPVTLMPDTLTYDAYGRSEVAEQFTCNYGLNPLYRHPLETGGIRVAGCGEDGGVRIIELHPHRFFLATLFVPQLSSTIHQPHPLLVAFLKAALDFQSERTRDE